MDLGFYLDSAGGVTPINSNATKTWQSVASWGGMGNGNIPYGAAQNGTVSQDNFGYAYTSMMCVWAFNAVGLIEQKVSELLTDGRLYDKYTNKPLPDSNPYQTAIALCRQRFNKKFYNRWVRSQIIYGETYIELIYATAPDGRRWLATFKPLNNLGVYPQIQGGEVIGYQVLGTSGGMSAYLNPDDVVFDHSENEFDDLRGSSPLATALSAVNVDMQVQRYLDHFMRNNARPGIVFSMRQGETPSTADWESFILNVQEQVKGANNAGKPLALSLPMEVTTVDPPSFTDQTELMNAQKERIAAALRIPVPLITFGDARYQLSPEQRLMLYEDNLIPTAKAIAEMVNIAILPHIIPSAELRLNEDKIGALLEDKATKTQMYLGRYQNGTMTLNELRVSLGETALEGGDVLLKPMGLEYVPLAKLPVIHAPDEVIPTELVPNPPNTLPIESVYITDDTLKELRNWHKKVVKFFGKKGGNTPFSPDYIPLHVERYLIKVLPTVSNATDVNAVFDRAKAIMSVKAIATTQEDFRQAFSALLEDAITRAINKTTFIKEMTTLVNDFGQLAYQDAIIDLGIADGLLSDENLSELDTLYTNQQAFIQNLADELWSDTPPTAAQIEEKPTMWIAKTLMAFYLAGQVSNAGERNFEWILGATEEHCVSCVTLNGQVHTMREYRERGWLPQSEQLECKGFNCKCELKVTSKRKRGNLNAVKSHRFHSHGNNLVRR